MILAHPCRVPKGSFQLEQPMICQEKRKAQKRPKKRRSREALSIPACRKVFQRRDRQLRRLPWPQHSKPESNRLEQRPPFENDSQSRQSQPNPLRYRHWPRGKARMLSRTVRRELLPRVPNHAGLEKNSGPIIER